MEIQVLCFIEKLFLKYRKASCNVIAMFGVFLVRIFLRL